MGIKYKGRGNIIFEQIEGDVELSINDIHIGLIRGNCYPDYTLPHTPYLIIANIAAFPLEKSIKETGVE